MIEPMFLSMITASPTGVGTGAVLAVMSASYAIIKLIEYENYGPFGVLKIYDKLFTEIFGFDYCSVCMTFWVALSVMFLLPAFVTFGMAAIGLYIALEAA